MYSLCAVIHESVLITIWDNLTEIVSTRLHKDPQGTTGSIPFNIYILCGLFDPPGLSGFIVMCLAQHNRFIVSLSVCGKS